MTHFYFEIWNKPNINSIRSILNFIFVQILFAFTSIIDDVIHVIERSDVDIEPVQKIWREILQFPNYRMLRVPVTNLSPVLSVYFIFCLHKIVILTLPYHEQSIKNAILKTLIVNHTFLSRTSSPLLYLNV